MYIPSSSSSSSSYPNYPEIEPIRNCILNYLASDEERRKASSSWNIKVTDNILIFVFKNHVQSNPTYLTFDTQITTRELADRTLTRHLTTEQIRNIQSFRTSSEKVNAFVLTLKKENGITSLIENFDYKELPILALIAHIKRGDVTTAQVASICLLYQALSQLIFEKKTYSCEWDSSVQPTAFNVTVLQHPSPPRSALSKLRTLSIFEHGSFIQKFFKLTDIGLRRLQQRLESRSTPVSERYFHTIDLPLGSVMSWSPCYHHIIANAKSYFFEPVDKDQTSFALSSQEMVIPSFPMLQAYLSLVYGKNAISLMPLIGECIEKTITTYKLEDRRVLQVGMPQAPTPDIADDFPAGTFLFSLHDMFHGILDSLIKKSERKAICHIIDRILKKDINDKTARIKWRLADGGLYLSEQHFGHLFIKDNRLPWDDANKRCVLEDMALLSEFWQEEFGITREHLLPQEQALYDTIVSTISKADKEMALDLLFDYYMSPTSMEDASALFTLGGIYFTNKESKLNYIRAFTCFKKAAGLGHPKATSNIAIMYRDGQGVERNLTKYAEYMRIAAKRSSVNALLELGIGHYTGNTTLSTPQDYVLAFKYFSQAAGLGHPEATYNVAIMYRDGQGVERNLTKYAEYMRKAAERSSIDALLELGIGHYTGNTTLSTPQDYALAFKYFSQAADLEHPKATHIMALMYRDGQGVEKNLIKYAKYMRKAAELSDKDALFVLGGGHCTGNTTLSTPQDYALAFKYFSQAAALGHPKATRNVAIMYRDGQGVERNLDKRAEYTRKAAELSDIESLYLLGSGHLTGDTTLAMELSTPQDDALAFKYFSQAADLGHLESIFNVALMYRDGQGVEKNLIKYKEYIQKAAALGFQPAIDILATIS